MIDLNSPYFRVDPTDPTTVTVTSDDHGIGATATFVESLSLGQIFLSNDPFLGDPKVIVAGPGVWLQFHYEFIEGPTEGTSANNDEFGAWIVNPATGWSVGAPYEVFRQASDSGTVSFDLSSLSSTAPWGLQFQLSSLSGDSGTDSTLKISNVQLVPEPVTVVALGSLLVGIFAARRLKRE
jgi:hypothetical protein